jgi:hypothetical protein
MIERLDRPPIGWFVLAVLRTARMGLGRADDHLKNCTSNFPALFYVHPKEYRPGQRKVQQRWVRIPGKHRSRNSAWDALENMMATRH